MSMHIGNLSSRVHVSTGDLPFTDEQLDKLTELVRVRIARHERGSRESEDATRLRRTASPADPVLD
jgi:hypothetical protein